MSIRVTLATARRVLLQLRHDLPVVRNRPDVHVGVGALDGEDVASPQEGRGRVAEHGGVLVGIRLEAIHLQQDVLDVPLGKASLPENVPPCPFTGISERSTTGTTVWSTELP